MVKKSHYIPKFKIKRFSTKSTYVNCYDKECKKYFKSSVDNILCEGKIYDYQPEIITGTFGEQFIERKLFAQSIEPKIACIENKIIDNTYTFTDLDELSKYVYMQIFRVKSVRDAAIQYAKHKGKTDLEAEELFIKLLLGEGSKEEAKNNFISMSKTIIRSIDDFLLCDRLGIVSADGSSLLYPVSKNIYILFEYTDTQYYLDTYVDVDEVANINKMVFNEAKRFIIGEHKETIDNTIKHICTEIYKQWGTNEHTRTYIKIHNRHKRIWKTIRFFT